MKKTSLALAFILCTVASQAQTTVTTTGGTANQIPKFDSTGTAIVNSAVTEINGNVGIGTTTPGAKLDIAGGGININGGGIGIAGIQSQSTASAVTTYAIDGNWAGIFPSLVNWGWNGIVQAHDIGIIYSAANGNPGSFVIAPWANTTSGLRIDANGNVGIGSRSPQAMLDVAGNVKISGSGANLTFPDGSTQSVAWNGIACGGDYAESVDVAGNRAKYEPGDVLVLTSEGSDGDVQKAQEAYSTTVAGIYATKPGITGRRQTGDLKESKTEVPMAMVGIVPTKVTTENGPITRGDLLVTSSTSGYAMKGTDRTKMLGAVIGKAMGSLKSGNGIIEVLVTLQ